MEQYLTAAGTEKDVWCLYYLSCILECDVPILEAHWHNCHKFACVRWDTTTSSFRNDMFWELLLLKIEIALQGAYPDWESWGRESKWMHREPPLDGAQFYAFFVLEYDNELRHDSMWIRLAAGASSDHIAQAHVYGSFGVRWKRIDPRLEVAIDHEKWQTVEAYGFLQLLEAQIARFSKLFYQYARFSHAKGKANTTRWDMNDQFHLEKSVNNPANFNGRAKYVEPLMIVEHIFFDVLRSSAIVDHQEQAHSRKVEAAHTGRTKSKQSQHQAFGYVEKPSRAPARPKRCELALGNVRHNIGEVVHIENSRIECHVFDKINYTHGRGCDNAKQKALYHVARHWTF